VVDEIRFGVSLPTGMQSELELVSADPQEQFRAIVEYAQLIERSGFDVLHVADHFHNTPASANHSVFECWTTLTAVAMATSRVQLGQMVNCAVYRNPALLAKITSNIDVISGGRLLWAVGAGWYEPEFTAYGYEFAAPGRRIDALQDTLRIVSSMWQQASTTYAGKEYSVIDAQCDPKPVQSPRPPIWVGGHGPRLIGVAAREADVLLTGGNDEVLATKLATLDEACAKIGRDPESIGRAWLGRCEIRDTEDEIRARYEEEKARARAERTGGDLDEAWKKIYDESYEAYSAKFLMGTAEQVRDKLERLVGMGCRSFVLQFDDFPVNETFRRFVADVLPNFAAVRA
jgi:alkanesulfonate monooxygenase SsuD/methylene tetrahydromethanopterin reductase-like flavin-dependent oxidoreductase (luciferase family)